MPFGLTSAPLVLLSTAVFVLLSSSHALGATPEDETRARTLWAEGLQAHKKEDWKGAVEQWAQAYALDPRPDYLWGLARDEHRAGLLEKAKRHYTAFLALDTVPNELQSQLAQLRAEAAGHIAAIQVELDRRRRAGDHKAREAALKRQAERERKLRLEAQQMAKRDKGAGMSTAGWVVLGTGVALVCGGAGFTVWGTAAADEMAANANPPASGESDAQRGIRQHTYDNALTDKRTREAVAGVLYGIGGTALVTGAVLLILNATDATDATDTSEGATDTAAISPWWTDHSAGLSVRGSF